MSAGESAEETESAIAAAWRAAYGAWDPFEAAAFHQVAKRTLGRLLAELEGRGIQGIVVKGALLAHTLYGRPVERPLRDLDLRVRGEDLPRVAEYLASRSNARLVRYSRVARNVVALFDGVEVDFEAALSPPFVCALPMEEVFARARRTSDDLGFEHLRIDTHDHALLLAIDLFKDHVSPKPWSRTDLARIVRVASFDGRALAERAARGRCTTIVHAVARHLALSLDDARWAAVAARVVPARAGYAERMIATLGGERQLPSFLRRLEVRAASDSHLRSLAAVAASALWALTEYGSVRRESRGR